MAWTTPPTYTTGQLITAVVANQQWRDNENLLATSIDTATGKIAGAIKRFSEDVSTVAFSATPTFDLSVANNFTITLTGNITSITVSNWTASEGTPVTLRFLQDATGGRTVAIPGGWKGTNGVTPGVATTANKATVIVIWSPDGGTTIYAAVFVSNA